MSGKRQATTDLNHDNWNQEEEPEERGTFRTASDNELKNRVIKKARRKITAGATSDAADGGGGGGASKSVFSSFAGFGKSTAASGSGGSTSTASPFSFLSKLPTATTSSSGTSADTNTDKKPTFSFGGAATTSSVKSPPDAKKSEAIKPIVADADTGNKTAEKSANYYAKLKGLNQTVSEWIKTHVDKNPLCVLTPIFLDYEKYWDEIQKEEESGKAGGNKPLETFKFSSSATAATKTSTLSPTKAGFSFSSAATSTAAEKTETSTTSSSIFSSANKASTSSESPKTNGFSFGLKTQDKSSAAAPTTTFSFGSSSSSVDGAGDKKPAAPTGFSFTPGAAPFSFGNIQPPAAMPSTSSAAAEEEEEDDQPPKVEFKQVVEDDAVFSKKCKVFVKKDGNFADRGVGTLYLKPVKDSSKTQLLVRADTNLGNILVNLLLSEAIPAQRMGKNNVMLVCLPTPDVEKPTPMLLRVKTGDEADELLETIEKYKK